MSPYVIIEPTRRWLMAPTRADNGQSWSVGRRLPRSRFVPPSNLRIRLWPERAQPCRSADGRCDSGADIDSTGRLGGCVV